MIKRLKSNSIKQIILETLWHDYQQIHLFICLPNITAPIIARYDTTKDRTTHRLLHK